MVLQNYALYPDMTVAGNMEYALKLRGISSSERAAKMPGALVLTVALVEELGADAYVYGTLAGDPPGERPWVVRCAGRAAPRIGDRVGVTVDGAEVHLFDHRTGMRVEAAAPIPAR